MSQRAATIESLKAAFEVVKAVQAGGLGWGEGYRPLGRRASAEIIEGRMSWRFVQDTGGLIAPGTGPSLTLLMRLNGSPRPTDIHLSSGKMRGV